MTAETGHRAPCKWCSVVHADRYLCDPMKRFLDEVAARGAQFDVPDMTFDQPIGLTESSMGLDHAAGDRFLLQVTAMGAMVQVGEAHVPCLILSGTGADGRALPRWLYGAPAGDLVKVSDLIRRQIDGANRAAARANRARG